MRCTDGVRRDFGPPRWRDLVPRLTETAGPSSCCPQSHGPGGARSPGTQHARTRRRRLPVTVTRPRTARRVGPRSRYRVPAPGSLAQSDAARSATACCPAPTARAHLGRQLAWAAYSHPAGTPGLKRTRTDLAAPSGVDHGCLRQAAQAARHRPLAFRATSSARRSASAVSRAVTASARACSTASRAVRCAA